MNRADEITQRNAIVPPSFDMTEAERRAYLRRQLAGYTVAQPRTFVQRLLDKAGVTW